MDILKTSGKKHRGVRTQLALLLLMVMAAITAFELVSFSRIQVIFNRKSQSYLESQIDQIAESIDDTLAYIRTLGYLLVDNENIQALLAEERTSDVLTAAKASDDLISLFSQADTNIFDVILVDVQGGMRSFLGQVTIFDYRRMSGEYDFSSREDDDPFYYPWGVGEQNSRFNLAFILPVRESVTITQNRRIGSLVIFCTFDDLNTLSNNPGIAEGESYFLLNRDDTVLASSRRADYHLLDLINENGAPYSVTDRSDLGFLGWSLLGILKNNVLSDEYELANQLIFFNLAMILVLLVLILVVVNRNITKPIAVLARDISAMELSDKGISLPQPSQAEFEMIVASVNRFHRTIKKEHEEVLRQTALLYENNLARKHTELAALQSQINPHFLYNTLECIRSIGAAYGSREIMEISTAMASIFRYSIKENDQVPLEKEIGRIREYLKIMDIRFGGKYPHHIDIPDTLLSVPILKMTIQPLVENAFYHGLENKTPPGELNIKGEFGKGKVTISVTDTGKGMDPDQLASLKALLDEGVSGNTQQLPQKKKIGLMNIHHRCVMAYGAEYGLEIKSEETRGTEIIVSFPFVDG